MNYSINKKLTTLTVILIVIGVSALSFCLSQLYQDELVSDEIKFTFALLGFLAIVTVILVIAMLTESKPITDELKVNQKNTGPTMGSMAPPIPKDFDTIMIDNQIYLIRFTTCKIGDQCVHTSPTSNTIYTATLSDAGEVRWVIQRTITDD